MERTAGRQIDPVTGRVYHKDLMPAEEAGAYTRSRYSSTRETPGHVHELSWVTWWTEELMLSWNRNECKPLGGGQRGGGSHSFTSQLNLSRFGLTSSCPPV
jgi:hypothetical protein